MKIAISAANRGMQISSRVQPHIFLVSLGKRSCNNASGPVRYIPKTRNSRKDAILDKFKKKEDILIKNDVLKDKRGFPELPEFDGESYRRFSRCNEVQLNDIFEQHEEHLNLDDANGSALELLDVNDVSSKSELIFDSVSSRSEEEAFESDRLIARDIKHDASKLAIELLATRAYTELELRKKLNGKKYPTTIVESVITYIKSRGMLNDELYAESFSRSKWLSLSWGPRRIKQALINKGVKVVEAEKAAKQVFEGDEADKDNKALQHGMSKSSMDRLFLQASKQWLRSTNTSSENRKARIVRWLQYRGFSWGVVNSVLKRLQDQYPQ